MARTEEEIDEANERLAESLVAEALAGYEKFIEADMLEEIRLYLVDELLCTSYGLERLRLLRGPPVIQSSGDVVIPSELLRESDKKKDSG